LNEDIVFDQLRSSLKRNITEDTQYVLEASSYNLVYYNFVWKKIANAHCLTPNTSFVEYKLFGVDNKGNYMIAEVTTSNLLEEDSTISKSCVFKLFQLERQVTLAQLIHNKPPCLVVLSGIGALSIDFKQEIAIFGSTRPFFPMECFSGSHNFHTDLKKLKVGSTFFSFRI